MNVRVLDYLRCLHCGGALTLADPSAGLEVESGELRCAACGHGYPVVRGIPRLLPDELTLEKLRTASAFGWEWQEFDSLHDDRETYHGQFLDWVHPIEPDFFRGKVVLDGGCGMGRFAAAAAEFGAKDVLAIDLSDAVEAAYRNTKHLPNVHVIQADIYRLPFGRSVDFAFSIGVLHHLPDPEGGFSSLVGHLKPGGSVFAWVYGRENNGWIVRLVNPMRERFFSRLPRKVLYALSFAATVALHPVLKLLYLPANRIARFRSLASILPYNGYLSWLAQFGFRHNHHVIFDHLVAPTAFYITRDEFRAWFAKAALSEPRISWRNQNSWRGWAVLEHADSRA